jgi:SAM-dependent methyltransferase
MNEQSKAAIRRKNDPRFASRWFVGQGIDIGCGNDPLNKEDWPLVTEVHGYDQILGHKDAFCLPEVPNNSYDFAVSSHCLEHTKYPNYALHHWARVVKPGGFLVVTVPDEYMYEHGVWPSQFNSDHKSSFTMTSFPIIPTSINVPRLLLASRLNIEHISLLTNGFVPELIKLGMDQTNMGAECAIEFVLRK